MTVTEIILPIVKGAFVGIVIIFILYGFIKVLKFVGAFKLFKRKPKTLPEEYEIVAKVINDKSRYNDLPDYMEKLSPDKLRFQIFSEWLSQFPYSKQKIYLNAYYRIVEEMDKLKDKSKEE